MWAGWSSGGLVVVGGVDGQFAEEFAGGGVDDVERRLDGGRSYAPKLERIVIVDHSILDGFNPQ